MDLHELAQAINSPGKQGRISPQPQLRIAMSVQAFLMLRNQIEQIARSMKTAGIDLDAVSSMTPKV